jgi:hypothetical protein
VNHRSPERFCAGSRKTVCQPRADTLESRGTLRGSLKSSRRGAYRRGPLERGNCALLARGLRRGRGRGHGHRASSLRGGLASQVHCLNGSRADASPGWPNRSPSLTASCTSAQRHASCSGACPSPRGTCSSETSTRACVATTRRRAPSWETRSAGFLLSYRGC